MADAANNPQPGLSLGRYGRYTLIRELGRGAMGVVYSANDPMIERTVAVKTITAPVPDPDTDGFLKRFFREAQAAGKLTHPNTVTIFDVGQDAQTRAPYIVMEYVDGVTLDAVL
ncbi:hypothetical protein B0B25_31315, partial [Pseudomonas aeruginosa]|uniref:protein kinase domain-containing protein n=1 Tax=Pseudomonas aeruginosa TaxID=287 RepID=UPI0009CFD72D